MTVTMDKQFVVTLKHGEKEVSVPCKTKKEAVEAKKQAEELDKKLTELEAQQNAGPIAQATPTAEQGKKLDVNSNQAQPAPAAPTVTAEQPAPAVTAEQPKLNVAA